MKKVIVSIILFFIVAVLYAQTDEQKRASAIAGAAFRKIGDYTVANDGHSSNSGNSCNFGGRLLKGRLYQPSYDGQEEGKIVVKIKIDIEGKVIEAKIGEGTTIKSESMRQKAIDAAKRNVFTQGDKVVEGTITYQFILNESTHTKVIGDKAYYGVQGNVKQIIFDNETIEFNKMGQSLCLVYTKSEVHKDSTDYIVPDNEAGELIVTYDKQGRLIKYRGYETTLEQFKYDSVNRLISFVEFGLTGFREIYYFYDSNGVCTNSICKNYESGWDSMDKKSDENGNEYGLVSTETYTFEVIKKDSEGNWLKRKLKDGTVMTRRIIYYE